MIVDVDREGARLLDATNFRSLTIRSALDAPAIAKLLGSTLDEDGNHIWIAGDWFHGQREAVDREWRIEFESMVAYAGAKGWTNGTGAIRAHIDRTSVGASGPASGIGAGNDLDPAHPEHQ